MKAHHLIDQLNQRFECPYCHNNLQRKDWGSNFDLTHHYKEAHCDQCGRTISVKVHFNGSGHDCWDKNSVFCRMVGGLGPSVTATTP